PDRSFIQPITYGPTNPPRFPTALINAMPPAAPVPRRNAVGSGQNGGVALYSPTAAKQSARKDIAGAPASALTVNPDAASHALPATCHRRSPVRSECAATVTMPKAANRNGSALKSPTARSDDPERPLTICGRKKLKPYPLVTIRNRTPASRQTVGFSRPLRSVAAAGCEVSS